MELKDRGHYDQRVQGSRESIQLNWKLLPSELYGKYSHDDRWRP